MRRRDHPLVGPDNLRHKIEWCHLISFAEMQDMGDRKNIMSEPQPSQLPFDDSDSEGQVK
jgi:hypothetical protein